jgi:hypothetical protein
MDRRPPRLFLCYCVSPSSLLTYLLTPWCRILLEKLIVPQLVKKFPALYGTWRFSNAFTRARHLSLFWAKGSVRLRGFLCEHFAKRYVFTVSSCQHLAKPPSWRTTPCRLSATAYSIYSQLPSTLEAVPPSATRGPAMPWWQGPTYHSSLQLTSLYSYPVFELFGLQECWHYSLLVTSVWVCLSQTTYRTLMEYISWQAGTSLKQLHPYQP